MINNTQRVAWKGRHTDTQRRPPLFPFITPAPEDMIQRAAHSMRRHLKERANQ